MMRAMVNVRPLDDDDLPALRALLEPVEHRSMFLVGNATEHGIADRGGPLQGTWFGAFEGGALRGVIAHFRGPDAVTPACEGHGDVLVPALLARLDHVPYVVNGTRDRVAEVLPHLPPSWAIAWRQREVLLALAWERYRRPADARAAALPEARAEEAAALIGVLHREWSLPDDEARNLASARRMTAQGRVRVREEGGRAVAMSCWPVASGRYVHVGATVCDPAHRRRGLTRACVAAVLDDARAQGLASEGAALFTGEDNHNAIALYESLGFARDTAWEMCFLKR